MRATLSKEEAEFVRWMDEVDLDEVNLLHHEPSLPTADLQQRVRLSGDDEQQVCAPSRGVGWDEG